LLFVFFASVSHAQEITVKAKKASQSKTDNAPKWTQLNANRLESANGKSAEVKLKGNENSESILLSDFGIDLPNNSRIGSIVVNITGLASESEKIIMEGLTLMNQTNNDSYSQLAGTYRLQRQGSMWATVPTMHSFGGSVVGTWGTAISQQQVEAESFGIALVIRNNSSANKQITAEIDEISLTITYDVQAPLPVNFVSFKGYKTMTGNELVWKVAEQVNVKGYDVERSSDGIQFSKIGYVAASENQDSYTFTDIQPTPGTVYYRIKNVDNDGAYKYSTVVAIKNGAASIVLKAFPIPAQNQVTLQHNEAGNSAIISLVGFDGRMVKTIRPTAGSMQTEINLTGLPSGMYVVRYDNGKGQVEMVKVVKQ
jgi:hypothetical protein